MMMFKHTPKFLNTTEAETGLEVLQACIPWEQFPIAPNSRRVYRWRPGTCDADGLLLQLQYRLEATEGVHVHGIFLNLYENGNDYCPYHKDQYGTDVYTISLGASRDLLIKPDHLGQTIKITLNSGDLYYMPKSLHIGHKHSIPKRTGVFKPRISIVFFTTPCS